MNPNFLVMLEDKLKSFLPKYILSKIYYAFIHSCLSYGLIIWRTLSSNLSKLCRIQNKALRVITGTGWREHAPTIYATQKILQLSKLITYSVASLWTNLQIRSFPQLLITLPPLRKFIHVILQIRLIHVILQIRLSQVNILFLFFTLYELNNNIQLNLKVQRLGMPSLMT